MLAEAFDIVLAGHDPHEVEALAREVGFHGIGRFPEKGFIHCDIRPAAQAATWGPEWPFGEDDDLAPPPPALPGILGAVPAAVEATKAAAQARFANAAKAKARAACE